MTGIFILFLMLLWIAVSIWLSAFITRKLSRSLWRVPVAMLATVLLLPLPLLDEIVGKQQFERLCKENSMIQVNRETAVGRTVYFDPQPSVEIKGTWVRVVLRPQRFVDLTTSETVLSYNELIAAGGWLIHKLGISEGGVPLIFRGTCVPPNRPGSVETFKSYGINYVEPPLTKK
jgi:hypothetical protein